MSTIKSILVIAALACGSAMAQERPPKVGETRDPPKEVPAASEKNAAPVRQGEMPTEKSAEPAKRTETPLEKAVEPGKANPTKDERTKKPPLKRRAVHQVVETMPRNSSPISYGPVLTPPSARPLPSVMPPSPVPIGSCLGASCTDTGGTHYNGGVGTTLLSPSGRLCNNNGTTVSCF